MAVERGGGGRRGVDEGHNPVPVLVDVPRGPGRRDDERRADEGRKEGGRAASTLSLAGVKP